MIRIKVNGKSHELADVPGETPLLWVLRDNLGLTGTKYGCGVSECGACTVHLDGKAIQACVTAVSEVGDSEVTTIEGLSTDGSHPVQKAWKQHKRFTARDFRRYCGDRSCSSRSWRNRHRLLCPRAVQRDLCRHS